jgi:hypothetical protein
MRQFRMYSLALLFLGAAMIIGFSQEAQAGEFSFCQNECLNQWDGVQPNQNNCVTACECTFTLGSTNAATIVPVVAIVQPASPDLNNDCCVDRTDLDLLRSRIRAGGVQNLSYDINGDAKVTIADARKLVLLFSNPGGVQCYSPEPQ